MVPSHSLHIRLKILYAMKNFGRQNTTSRWKCISPCNPQMDINVLYTITIRHNHYVHQFISKYYRATIPLFCVYFLWCWNNDLPPLKVSSQASWIPEASDMSLFLQVISVYHSPPPHTHPNKQGPMSLFQFFLFFTVINCFNVCRWNTGVTSPYVRVISLPLIFFHSMKT